MAWIAYASMDFLLRKKYFYKREDCKQSGYSANWDEKGQLGRLFGETHTKIFETLQSRFSQLSDFQHGTNPLEFSNGCKKRS